MRSLLYQMVTFGFLLLHLCWSCCFWHLTHKFSLWGRFSLFEETPITIIPWFFEGAWNRTDADCRTWCCNRSSGRFCVFSGECRCQFDMILIDMAHQFFFIANHDALLGIKGPSQCTDKLGCSCNARLFLQFLLCIHFSWWILSNSYAAVFSVACQGRRIVHWKPIMPLVALVPGPSSFYDTFSSMFLL